jgi:hypothetical protein
MVDEGRGAGRIGRVGRLDQVIRIVLGVVLVGFALFCPWAAELGPVVQWISSIVGIVLIATAMVRTCPLYRALGLRSG